MKRIKTIVSFLCAAALALTLLVMPSSASGGLFFLSLNDTLPAQSVQMTPVQYSGWVYVPVNVFNSQSTGVNFGLYYGLTENNTKLVLYNLSGKTMTFDLQNGTATAVGGEAPVPGKVLRQNGVYYVPAYAVCRYFGLSYSFYSTAAAAEGRKRHAQRFPVPQFRGLDYAKPDQQLLPEPKPQWRRGRGRQQHHCYPQ